MSADFFKANNSESEALNSFGLVAMRLGRLSGVLSTYANYNNRPIFFFTTPNYPSSLIVYVITLHVLDGALRC
jgi:hypothetical protein